MAVRQAFSSVPLSHRGNKWGSPHRDRIWLWGDLVAADKRDGGAQTEAIRAAVAMVAAFGDLVHEDLFARVVSDIGRGHWFPGFRFPFQG